MKHGTVVQIIGRQAGEDRGRLGTVVYHSLDGYGIIWGADITIELLREDELPPPEAMLRNAYPRATLPCVGERYLVTPIAVPLIPIDAETAYKLLEIEADAYRGEGYGLPDKLADDLKRAYPALYEELIPR